jgi:hypothetical protein
MGGDNQPPVPNNLPIGQPANQVPDLRNIRLLDTSAPMPPEQLAAINQFNSGISEINQTVENIGSLISMHSMDLGDITDPAEIQSMKDNIRIEIASAIRDGLLIEHLARHLEQ